MLKAGSLAVTLCLGFLLLTPPALAASLLTGAIRDMHGAPIINTRVIGLDSSGTEVGRTTSDTDGTFALSTNTTPASVRLQCAYCRTVTIAVVAGEPIVAVVTRYDALVADGPTSADLAALPYIQIENALALRPFEVRHFQYAPLAASGPALSDRGLATSSLVLDGQASTYFLGGQGNGFSTTPTHAGDAPVFVAASQAYQYGAYATGGIIQLSRNSTLFEQAGYGDSSFLRASAGTPAAGISLGGDADDMTHRERAIASGVISLLGGTLASQLSASRASTLAGSQAFGLSQQSVTLDFSRAFNGVFFRISAAGTFGTQDFLDASSNVWTDLSTRALVSARVGAFDLEGGNVYTNATNYFPEFSAAAYPQTTTYLKAHLSGPTTLDVGLGDTAYRSVPGGSGHTSALPSLLAKQSLGDFALTAGYSQSLVATSGSQAGFVASLVEAHLEYGDGKRLRAQLQTYRQTYEREVSPLSGTGLSLEYQLTPTTSIRAWTLRLFGDEPLYAADAYVSGDTLWLTNQNGRFRVDAIYRRVAGNLIFRRTFDGDVYFPIADRASIGLRSELRPQGRRNALVLSIQP